MTPLLCLHGFTGRPASWDFLSDSGARFTPALVGHQGSVAGAEVLHFDDEVDRLARLAHDAPALHVVGYSLGARLALGFALRHPQRVARLTLISGHPGLTSESERIQRRASDAAWCDLLETRGLEAFVSAWQDQPLWASQARLPAAVSDKKKEERLSHTSAGLCRSLQVTGLAQMPNYLPALGELGMPVTVLAGALDPKFCDLARILAQTAPVAELKIVPDSGHDLLLERPDFITAVIRRGNPT